MIKFLLKLKMLAQALVRAEQLFRRIEQMVATQADLDSALDELKGDIASAVTEMNAAFARLEAKIGQSGLPDLIGEVQKVKDLHLAVLNAIAASQAEGTVLASAPEAPLASGAEAPLASGPQA